MLLLWYNFNRFLPFRRNAISEKTKEIIEENAELKRNLFRPEADNQQLRKGNEEMTAYMAEISQLLDSLEADREE